MKQSKRNGDSQRLPSVEENLARLFSGNLSKADVQRLRGWRQRSPEYQQAYQQTAHWVSDAQALADDPMVDQWLEETAIPHPAFRWTTWASLAAAAVLVLAVGVMLAPWQSGREVGENYLYITRIGEQKSIALPDGSLVNLNTNTQLKVRYSNKGRDLELVQGEAYFNVKPDEQRPFSVLCGNRVITALGTAFNVWQRQDKLTLAVAEGLVALHRGEDTNFRTSGMLSAAGGGPVALNVMGSYHITAGMVAELDRVDNRLVAYADANLEKRLAWREGTLRFEAATLDEVVTEINRYSTREIRIMDDSIRGLKLYSTFRSDRIAKALAGMEKSLPVRLAYKEDVIEIHKK